MSVCLKYEYYDSWLNALNVNIQNEFSILEKKELEPHSFTFYISVSVMSSSKIEGEQLEVDSYVKHKMLNIEYLPELTEKPNDLYKAYLFANDNHLTESNFSKAHKLITEHLLPLAQRGVLRNTEMLVMEHKTGRIQYEAIPRSLLKEEYNKFWKEVSSLLKKELTLQETFYYASFIHLVFVNIHPFMDGNGRAARLLEKWFLAHKLGERAWYLQTEKYYYKNLSRLGLFYEALDYEKSFPFLLMIPHSLVFDQ
jgi:Fic family protein